MVTGAFAGLAQESQPEESAQVGAAEQPEQLVRVDFRGASVGAVVEYLALLMNLVPIVPEGVVGSLTFATPEPIGVGQAYRVISALLDARELSLIRDDMFLRVIAKADAVQEPLEVYFGADVEAVPLHDNVITQIVPITKTDASVVLESILPLIARTGVGFASRDTNVLVITDTASNVRRLVSLVNRLDVERVDSGTVATRVYPVRYLKATELAEGLEEVFQEGGSQSQTRVTPLDVVNSLVVTADLGTHTEIKRTIRAIDQRRRQVLIEVKIVEGTLSDELETGVNLLEWLFSSSNAVHAIAGGASVADPFVTYTLDSNEVDLVITAAARTDMINLLSAPRVLTSDNRAANIVIAQEEPILRSTTDLATTAVTPRTVSEFTYRDIGIQMDVTPRVNIDRDVALDVTFEITSLLANVDLPGETFAPRVGKRSATTGVVVADGRTLVIGGLMKSDVRDQRSKVPILGDVPLLGRLFSNVREVTQQTELLVFITPRVVVSPDEGDALTREQIEAMDIGLDLDDPKQRDDNGSTDAEAADSGQRPTRR
jgi:general secretion pathway protein D